MQKFSAAIAAFGLAAGVSTVARADIVYSIDQTSTTPEVSGELSPLSDTVSGTITTDGTLGLLQASNIVSYNLLLTDNLRPAYTVDLTPANSGIYSGIVEGLSASATGLSFDFSTPGDFFAIQGTFYGFSSGYQYFCFQATSGACIAGETIVPDYYAVDGVQASGLSGTLPLQPSGVPEPFTLSLFGAGLAGAAAMRRSKKAKA